MLRQALRAALLPKIKELAPDGLIDLGGADSLQVFLEDVQVSADPRAQATQWTDSIAVAVLYAVDDIERLIHHLALANLNLAFEANGLAATGAARFKSLKEGIINGEMYAELRFTLNGTIRGVAHG